MSGGIRLSIGERVEDSSEGTFSPLPPKAEVYCGRGRRDVLVRLPASCPEKTNPLGEWVFESGRHRCRDSQRLPEEKGPGRSLSSLPPKTAESVPRYWDRLSPYPLLCEMAAFYPYFVPSEPRSGFDLSRIAKNLILREPFLAREEARPILGRRTVLAAAELEGELLFSRAVDLATEEISRFYGWRGVRENPFGSFSDDPETIFGDKTL